MPAHDIIDNRNERLVDNINQILSSTDGARFAVGYFFLAGFTSIAKKLAGVKELRLLIGNTTNRETLEQLAEGYRRLDIVAEAEEKAFLKDIVQGLMDLEEGREMSLADVKKRLEEARVRAWRSERVFWRVNSNCLKLFLDKPAYIPS